MKTLSKGGISEAELHEDIPSLRADGTVDISLKAELRKQNIVRQSHLSGVAEMKLCEDIPHNRGILELLEDIPF